MFTFQSFGGSKMDDLVFENRNKAYGAYVIRKSYDETMFKSLLYALGIVVLFLGTGAGISKLYPTVITEKKKKKMVQDTTIVVIYNPDTKTNDHPQQKTHGDEVHIKIKAQNPISNVAPIIKDSAQIDNTVITKNNTLPKDTAGSTEGDPNLKGTITVKKNGDGNDGKPIEGFRAQVNPEFPGGEKALFQFLSSNLHYPEMAKENNTQGTVFVQFVVDMDGSVTNIQIDRGVRDGCSEEAVRVVNKMPKWKPGIYNDQPVKVIYRLPVKFILKGS